MKRLIRNLPVITQSGFQNGAHVLSVVKVNIGDFQPDQQGVLFNAFLDVYVKGSTSQYIALGASAGGSITYQGQVKLPFRLLYTGNQVGLEYLGMSWSQPFSHYVNVWTNARILRGAVLNGARQKAYGQVNQGKREIDQMLQQAIQQGLRQQTPELQKYFDEIKAAIEDVPNAQPRIYSENGRAHFQHLFAAKPWTKYFAPPALPAGVET